MVPVVLVQPPIQEFYLTHKRTIPYGLCSIAASLEQAGFKTRIIDGLACNKSKILDYPNGFEHLNAYYGQKDISLFSLFHRFRHFGFSHEHIANQVRECQPIIVGISSLFTAYSDQAIETAIEIKRFYPKAYMVAGGHHPTAFPEHLLESKAVDFVLRGDGEESMTALCKLLLSHNESCPGNKKTIDPEQLKAVPGLCFKHDQSIHINPPAWVNDLGALTMPAFDKINSNFYQRSKKASVTVVASRGCPFHCSYCSVSASSLHPGFRRRSTGSILEEIQAQADQKEIGFIDFEDENLTLDKTWILKLLAGISKIFKGKKVELRAMNGLYPPSLDMEILLAMKNSGFKTLNLSVGSFSKPQLKKFNRPDVRVAHGKVLNMALSLGLSSVSYIIGAAPGQTAVSSLEDLFILAGQKTLAGFSIFYPAPGSKDYSLCQKEKILPSNFTMMRSTALPIDHTTSRVEAVTLVRLARVINYIKSLADLGDSPPHALSWSKKGEQTLMNANRDRVSKILLQWFLSDGILRGQDGQGRIYAHQTDPDLIRLFLTWIRAHQIIGVKTSI